MTDSDKATELKVVGKKVVCPMCRYDKFWPRKTLMNTKMATLLKFDLANKEATNQVCDQCGYVLWFFLK